MDRYERLDGDQNARIVRCLCAVRSALLRNYKRVAQEIYYNLKNLHTLPDLIPQASVIQLEQDGLSIVKANRRVNKYIIDLNTLICDRINT